VITDPIKGCIAALADMLGIDSKTEIGAMKWFRLLAALFAAPLLYGLLCVPLLSWWMSLFPHQINELGGSFYTPLVVSIEVLQSAVLLLCGMVVAFLGGAGGWQKLCLMLATLDMLIIGVMVQTQFWEALPVWHHWVFFSLIALMMPFGGAITLRLQGRGFAD
jgi:hypothetical protein